MRARARGCGCACSRRCGCGPGVGGRRAVGRRVGAGLGVFRRRSGCGLSGCDTPALTTSQTSAHTQRRRGSGLGRVGRVWACSYKFFLFFLSFFLSVMRHEIGLVGCFHFLFCPVVWWFVSSRCASQSCGVCLGCSFHCLSLALGLSGVERNTAQVHGSVRVVDLFLRW